MAALAFLVHMSDDSGSDWDAPVTTVNALCGAQGFVFNDASVVPEGFDFVSVPDPLNQCTCAPCLSEFARRVVTDATAVNEILSREALAKVIGTG